jgi:integrase
MSVKIREIYPGKWYLRIRYRNIRKTKAAGSDLAYVSAQLGHANPSIALRIYSHWVPGTRRVSTAVLDTASANVRQMEALENDKEGEETTVSR